MNIHGGPREPARVLASQGAHVGSRQLAEVGVGDRREPVADVEQAGRPFDDGARRRPGAEIDEHVSALEQDPCRAQAVLFAPAQRGQAAGGGEIEAVGDPLGLHRADLGAGGGVEALDDERRVIRQDVLVRGLPHDGRQEQLADRGGDEGDQRQSDGRPVGPQVGHEAAHQPGVVALEDLFRLEVIAHCADLTASSSCCSLQMSA